MRFVETLQEPLFMPDLIPPHGGVSELVDRTVPASEIASFRAEAEKLVAVPISDADVSSLYRFADGGLTPLTGPMTSAVYNLVLEQEHIVSNGQKYAWTIPIAFPIDEAQAKTLKVGQKVALVNSAKEIVGTLDIEDIYAWDKVKYNSSVYATPRTDHPGARIANDDPRTFLLGGSIRALPQPKHPEYGDVVLTPRETRALFAKKG